MTLPRLLLQGKVTVNQPSCNHLQQAGPVDLKDGSRLVLRTALQNSLHLSFPYPQIVYQPVC